MAASVDIVPCEVGRLRQDLRQCLSEGETCSSCIEAGCISDTNAYIADDTRPDPVLLTLRIINAVLAVRDVGSWACGGFVQRGDISMLITWIASSR